MSTSHATPPDTLIAPNTVLPLTLPWADVAPTYTKLLNRMAKRVKLSGFRPGKVPAHIAESSIDRNHLLDHVLQEVLPPAYANLIKTHTKQPLSSPEFQPVSLEKGKDWELKVHIAEKPLVELKNYKKIVKSARKTGLEKFKEAEKAHKKAAKDEEKETPRAQTPPATKQAPPEERERDAVLNEIARELVVQVKPSIPELLVKRETEHELKRVVESLQQLNIPLDAYLQRRQVSFEQYSGEIASEALGRLQLEFILQAIAETEKLEATDEQVTAALGKMEDETQRERFKTNETYLHQLRQTVTRQNVIEHLLTIN